jgi:hypothetical protein
MANLLFSGPEAWAKIADRSVTEENIGDFMAVAITTNQPILESAIITGIESVTLEFVRYQARLMREWALENDRKDLLIPPILQMRGFQ